MHEKKNISVSKPTEQFFSSVKEGNEEVFLSAEISPWVKSISGIIPEMSEEEFRKKIRKRLRNKYK